SAPLPMMPLSGPETFLPQNLFKKINGKAELYLSAGFRKLESQVFQDAGNADFWMEVFIYDMVSSVSAFSVFSSQRRSGAPSLDLTPYGYRTDNAVFLAHGPYYVEIIASETSERVANILRTMAESFIKENRIEPGAVSEGDIFPVSGLVKNSISMIAANAFGTDLLDRVFTAAYESNGARIMAFLSRRNSAGEAAGLVQRYHAFLLEFGGRALKPDVKISDARMAEILETFELVFSHGPFLAGVRESPDKTRAEMLAARLFEQLKGAHHGP
ncbi:MAG: hypothetical protein Q8P24_21235, partial [Desulfobacterales bacterium]|nr:hypothetical protein [Desulfobacterales bacterium]